MLATRNEDLLGSVDLSTESAFQAALSEALGNAKSAMLLAAHIFVEGERLGRDISKHKWFRPIAHKIVRKQVLPEVYSQFGGTSLCKYLERIPPGEQKRLLGGGKVDLLVLNGTSPDVLKVAPQALTSSQLKQVFGSDDIREPELQRAWLEDQKAKAPVSEQGEPDIVINRLKVGVSVRGVFLSRAKLKKLLRDLSDL